MNNGGSSGAVTQGAVPNTYVNWSPMTIGSGPIQSIQSPTFCLDVNSPSAAGGVLIWNTCNSGSASQFWIPCSTLPCATNCRMTGFGQSNSICALCPPGTFLPSPGPCIPCYVGTFSSLSGVSS